MKKLNNNQEGSRLYNLGKRVISDERSKRFADGYMLGMDPLGLIYSKITGEKHLVEIS